MYSYVLVRKFVPLPHVLLAAWARTDYPDASNWLVDAARSQTICLLDDTAFERAKSFEGAIILTSTLEKGKELAIIFEPRDEWRAEFDAFRRFIDDDDDRTAKRKKKRKRLTEKIWLKCNTRPDALARFAFTRLSERKERLLNVACCELVIDKITDPSSIRAIEVARRHAYGKADDLELSSAFQAAYDAMISFLVRGQREFGRNLQGTPEFAAVVLASYTCSEHNTDPKSPESQSDYLISQLRRAANGDIAIDVKFTRILRDICGNPFRPVNATPEWLTPSVKSLAQAIHETSSFDRLPELAIELEIGGCNEPAVLNHCRRLGTHVRGCWVVDLALGFDT